jgi:hypothetical protein
MTYPIKNGPFCNVLYFGHGETFRQLKYDAHGKLFVGLHQASLVHEAQGIDSARKVPAVSADCRMLQGRQEARRTAGEGAGDNAATARNFTGLSVNGLSSYDVGGEAIMTELDSRLIRAEQRLRLAYAAIFLLILMVVCLGVGEVWAFHHPAYPEVMTLRRLNIVDQKGVARVILAAPAQEPLVGGVQHHRDGSVSGVIIADATGTERGGYVTTDGYANALLTWTHLANRLFYSWPSRPAIPFSEYGIARYRT